MVITAFQSAKMCCKNKKKQKKTRFQSFHPYYTSIPTIKSLKKELTPQQLTKLHMDKSVLLDKYLTNFES